MTSISEAGWMSVSWTYVTYRSWNVAVVKHNRGKISQWKKVTETKRLRSNMLQRQNVAVVKRYREEMSNW
jgi:predicted acetyltransferase